MGERLSRADALRQLAHITRENGRSLASHSLPSDLYQALLHHFGTLAAARQAANVAPAPYPHKWTTKRVLEELRKLSRKGIPMSHEALAERGRQDLLGGIRRYVGSLTRARRLARVPTPPRRSSEPEPWDEDRVVEEILDLHGDGKPLAASKAPKKLVVAGRCYFGSWGAAIAAAGLDYATIRLRRPPYEDDELLDLLRKLARQRPQLTLGELHDHTLAPTLMRRFPSMEAAAKQAGLDGWPHRDVHRPLSKPQTLAALRVRARAGQGVHRMALRRDDQRLWLAVNRHFDSVAAALAAARVRSTSPPRREWTRDEIKRELAWRKQHGLPLHGKAIQDAALGGLYQAAVREYGSYYAIAKEFGAVSPHRRWTKAIVIADLRQLAKQHQPFFSRHASVALRHACDRHFGSFRAALAAAGFPSASRRRTREDVLEELRRRARRGERLSARAVGSSLATACWRLFGSFAAAIKAAGVRRA